MSSADQKMLCLLWDPRFERAALEGIDAIATKANVADDTSIAALRRLLAARENLRLLVCLPEDWVADPREEIALELLCRVGRPAADFLVLSSPAYLRPDPTENGFDHFERLACAWTVMEGLAARGIAGQLGIRHAGRSLLEGLFARASVRPAINQIEYHPYAADDDLVAWCQKAGVAVHALDCLGPRRGDNTERPLLSEPELVEVAERQVGGAASACLRWCLQKTDGALLSAEDHALVGGVRGKVAPLGDADVLRLERLRCDARADRSASTLASLYGSLSAAPVRVVDRDTSGLEYGLYKVLYAPVSKSETHNKRFSEIVWRYAFNPVATSLHHALRPRLSTLARRIVADLDEQGFAITDVDELSCRGAFGELQRMCQDLEARALVGAPPKLPGDYRYEREHPAVRKMATAEITQAADAYFGMRTILDAAFLNTIVGQRSEARLQQLWHSDIEDYFVLKSFTYLTAVDEDSGPLEYIAGTHPKGRFAVQTAELWKRSFISDPTPTRNFQVTHEELFRCVRPDLLRRLVGPAGTVVLLDARGLHRGGHVLRGIRHIAVTSHLSPNQVHRWRLRPSPWSVLSWPFRWKTNVHLKRPPPRSALAENGDPAV